MLTANRSHPPMRMRPPGPPRIAIQVNPTSIVRMVNDAAKSDGHILGEAVQNSGDAGEWHHLLGRHAVLAPLLDGNTPCWGRMGQRHGGVESWVGGRWS